MVSACLVQSPWIVRAVFVATLAFFVFASCSNDNEGTEAGRVYLSPAHPGESISKASFHVKLASGLHSAFQMVQARSVAWEVKAKRRGTIHLTCWANGVRIASLARKVKAGTVFEPCVTLRRGLHGIREATHDGSSNWWIVLSMRSPKTLRTSLWVDESRAEKWSTSSDSTFSDPREVHAAFVIPFAPEVAVPSKQDIEAEAGWKILISLGHDGEPGVLPSGKPIALPGTDEHGGGPLMVSQLNAALAVEKHVRLCRAQWSTSPPVQWEFGIEFHPPSGSGDDR